ncbi:unnamed protein product [Periconia digitata]|uniref:DUF676 domain-containing protein n=1 Tax=Periconia digitata TaxID=1303443 RepID=A0A9W4UT47_9PLEO|nr:unnamed protein product [Periconia digitata]
MLLTPRTYSLSQIPDAGCTEPSSSYFLITPSRKDLRNEELRARRMLLLHQTGAVKVGEVIRYTVTYTPSEDRILPSPSHLHVRIRNTAAMPLRAAYLHGPYSLHVAAYPSTFNPNKKVESPLKEGVPEFEPDLKAGGSWSARLTVPENIREIGGNRERNEQLPQSATWIIEIASQIIFSQSASVSYELLVARDERSLDLGLTAVTGNTSGVPGQVEDHQQGKAKHIRKHSANPRGVYSKAVKLVVDDTTSLWNKPELPDWNPKHTGASTNNHSNLEDRGSETTRERKPKKIHLVILTHGLHSNLGADMLYLKESIDASAKQAQENRRRRRHQKRGTDLQHQTSKDASTAPLSGGQDEILDDNDNDTDDDDEEQIVVRGFEKNVVRTERGIQYLGKRLAKYVLEMTHPDQPYLPIKKSKFSSFSPVSDKKDPGIPSHSGSQIHKEHPSRKDKRAYKYTSISFIGHSLGGLVQTYAVAYIHKHSPEFFDLIKPVNFIGLATPFLGMSNENPMYVKFALDFGLVGRTGQDLGLTWRAPTIARSGWTAMVNGLGGQSSNQQKDEDPGSKPLLRILPAGPAHSVLRMFRNRTVYSNVVNDGIVPLRTSCLLFLDWRGLDKVEKARRENGLIGTVATWGFSQLTGQNVSPNPSRVGLQETGNDRALSREGAASDDRTQSPSYSGDDTTVPQPSADVTNQDDEAQAAAGPSANQWMGDQTNDSNDQPASPTSNQSALSTLWNYIRPSGKHTSKDKKMFKRSQTLGLDQAEAASEETTPGSDGTDPQSKRPRATRGDSLSQDPNNPGAPPKTTIFESAGDLLSPPTPPESWIVDPSTRARTIFHDRIYHPDDIPPPPSIKKKTASTRSFSNESALTTDSATTNEDGGGMRVEEKIARAYHRDLSWRKVLVRLEPDAHNNIVVRRMFANAYGWPVIKHICDTHFGDTFAAETRDEHEPAHDRAKNVDAPVKEDGEHVKGQEDIQPPMDRSESEMREVADELSPLQSDAQQPPRLQHAVSLRSKDSAVWDDMYFEGTSDEDDDEIDDRNAIQRFLQIPQPARKPSSPTSPKFSVSSSDTKGTSDADIADFLSSSTPPSHSRSAQPMEMHRGIGASPSSPTARAPSAREPDSLESMGGPHHFGAKRNSPGKGKTTAATSTAPASSPPHTPTRAPTNLSGVGLRPSFDVPSPSAVASAANEGRARSGSGRVSEQVARMASYSQEQQRSRSHDEEAIL